LLVYVRPSVRPSVRVVTSRSTAKTVRDRPVTMESLPGYSGTPSPTHTTTPFPKLWLTMYPYQKLHRKLRPNYARLFVSTAYNISSPYPTVSSSTPMGTPSPKKHPAHRPRYGVSLHAYTNSPHYSCRPIQIDGIAVYSFLILHDCHLLWHFMFSTPAFSVALTKLVYISQSSMSISVT